MRPWPNGFHKQIAAKRLIEFSGKKIYANRFFKREKWHSVLTTILVRNFRAVNKCAFTLVNFENATTIAIASRIKLCFCLTHVHLHHSTGFKIMENRGLRSISNEDALLQILFNQHESYSDFCAERRQAKPETIHLLQKSAAKQASCARC